MLGLPDFQHPIVQDDAAILWPSDPGGPLTVTPSGLALANRADGTLDFHLEVLRPAMPGLPPACG